MKTENELIAEFMGHHKDAVGLYLIPEMVNHYISNCAKILIDHHKNQPVKELSDFASQESKRAVDEFKEKLKREIREKSIVLYDASAMFALVDGLNTMIDKL